MITTRLFRIAAWLAFAAIIFVTISPIGFRPRDVISTNFDRAAAYAAMSALFVFAYPRHWWTVAVLVVVTAGGAELFQFVSPMRHPQLMDVAVKAAGGVLGLVVGLLLYSGTTRFPVESRK